MWIYVAISTSMLKRVNWSYGISMKTYPFLIVDNFHLNVRVCEEFHGQILKSFLLYNYCLLYTKKSFHYLSYGALLGRFVTGKINGHCYRHSHEVRHIVIKMEMWPINVGKLKVLCTILSRELIINIHTEFSFAVNYIPFLSNKFRYKLQPFHL